MDELWRVVVDVSDQDVNSGGGTEAWVALVCHHHLQSVLAVVLPVQCHPVDYLSWMGAVKTVTGRDAAQMNAISYHFGVTIASVLPVLASMRKCFPSESRM